MMKWLQKLGKALMLPVAALPVCGILMGIGYALAPAVMGAEGATTGAAYTIGFLLVKAGGALIDNMAWLFAIGAAVGLADDHDGTAGLAGLVSFLMMQQLLSPGVVGTIRAAVGSTLEEGTVDYIAFSKIAGNSFIGILAAVIGATCYNKFKSTKLPDWLAFFSGKRSVAIMLLLCSTWSSTSLSPSLTSRPPAVRTTMWKRAKRTSSFPTTTTLRLLPVFWLLSAARRTSPVLTTAQPACALK